MLTRQLRDDLPLWAEETSPKSMQALFRIVAIVVFALVVYYAVGTLTGGDCDTKLCCPDCETLSVGRIIDGDTFDANQGRVRLFGMDTPERGERCFGEATERLRDLAGDTVRVENGPRARDAFGRLLFYVYTNSGESIDEVLVREGLARAWTRDG